MTNGITWKDLALSLHAAAERYESQATEAAASGDGGGAIRLSIRAMVICQFAQELIGPSWRAYARAGADPAPTVGAEVMS